MGIAIMQYVTRIIHFNQLSAQINIVSYEITYEQTNHYCSRLNMERPQKHNSSNSLVNQLNRILFPLAEYSGLIQFRYSVERDELIESPRRFIQMIVCSIVYASIIYNDLTSAETISVAGEKSTLFNYGIGFITSGSFACSFCTVILTYILRKRIVKTISSSLAVERMVC